MTGGPAFIKAVGDKVLEGVVAENLPGILYKFLSNLFAIQIMHELG